MYVIETKSKIDGQTGPSKMMHSKQIKFNLIFKFKPNYLVTRFTNSRALMHCV